MARHIQIWNRESGPPIKHIMKFSVPLFLLILAASILLTACGRGFSPSIEPPRQRANKAEKQLGELQAKWGKTLLKKNINGYQACQKIKNFCGREIRISVENAVKMALNRSSIFGGALEKARQENEAFRKEVEKQRQRADNAETQLAKAKDEADRKKSENERLRKKLEAAETGKQRYGLVLLFLGLSIVGFGGWLFFPRKAIPAPSGISHAGRPTCPRCGREHDPGDTVCKNPACRTQF